MKDVLSRSPRAFTLMEIMIVIVILGILMAIVAPKFGPSIDEADRLEAKRKCHLCYEAVVRYKLKHHKLPADLRSLTQPDERYNFGASWLEARDLVDPWGNQLELRIENVHRFEVISYGSDGAPGGTEYFEMDISSARPLGEDAASH